MLIDPVHRILPQRYSHEDQVAGGVGFFTSSCDWAAFRAFTKVSIIRFSSTVVFSATYPGAKLHLRMSAEG